LVVDSKETGLEVNGDKTEYMVMSREQSVGRSHNVMTANSSFERVEFSHIWKQHYRMKILSREKLRAD